MSGNLLSELNGRGAREARSSFPIEGIVAINEDPEFQQRIMCTIPALDEDVVFQKWVRPLAVFVLGPGYGSFFVPPIGSEVLLFSRLGDKHNLFYTPVYNEDFLVPPDFRDTSVCGIRAPADMKFISDGDMQLRMGALQMESDAEMNLIAPGGFFVNGRRL
jgi:hypothetical protein